MQADEERSKLVIEKDSTNDEEGGQGNFSQRTSGESCGDGRQSQVEGDNVETDEGVEGEAFDDEASHDGDLPSQRGLPLTVQILHRCALPDDQFTVCGMKVVDGPPAIKLFKFVGVTFIGIIYIHWFVRRMGWEHREDFTMAQFWTYESGMVVGDALFFFVVARLWKQRGVDHLAWLLFALTASFYASIINKFTFLRESFTLYNMHCTWSWKLWLFVVILVPLVVTIILLHVNQAVRTGVFVMKLMELVLATMFLLIPYATSPYLHLHHWFAGWIIGMHCNFNVWWSRGTLAWCWGLYMNGIAVYGRDPVLTCGYTLFLSTQMRCPFLDCYETGVEQPQNDTHPIVKEMKTPDWRNCSADTYHP